MVCLCIRPEVFVYHGSKQYVYVAKSIVSYINNLSTFSFSLYLSLTSSHRKKPSRSFDADKSAEPSGPVVFWLAEDKSQAESPGGHNDQRCDVSGPTDAAEVGHSAHRRHYQQLGCAENGNGNGRGYTG